jgi:hypothetical protein
MKTAVKYDEGIKTKANYIELGKFMINMKFLTNNILLLKYKKSYAPVPNLRRQNISNDVRDILYYIIDTKNINYEDIRELEKKDNELIMRILELSGLDVYFRLDREKTKENIDDIILRFKIIQGEINAGNDNMELLNEAKELLIKLKKNNKITENDYNDLIREINEIS